MLDRIWRRLATGRGLRALGVAAAALVATTGVAVLGPADPASAAVCSRVAKTVSDSNGGIYGRTWTAVSYCGNNANAPIYAFADTSLRIGTMLSTTSWFVCYVHGAQHAGGNNIWYYTQGDVVVSHPEWHAWGFMPAVYVHTTNDPADSKLPAC